MSKRWEGEWGEESKEQPAPLSPTSAYAKSKARYFTRLAVINHAPSSTSRSSSHPASHPLSIPPPRLRGAPAATSSHSLPSASVPRSKPMDIPMSRRASAGWAERGWGEAERARPPIRADDFVDDSRIIWAGRGEDGEEDEGDDNYWPRYAKAAPMPARLPGGTGAYSARREEEEEEDDEAVVPFPLMPPSYCVDFEL